MESSSTTIQRTTICQACKLGKLPDKTHYNCASCGAFQHAECANWANPAIAALNYTANELPAVFFCQNCIGNFHGRVCYSRNTMADYSSKNRALTHDLNNLKARLAAQPANIDDVAKEMAEWKEKYEVELLKSLDLTNQIIVFEQENHSLTRHITELEKLSLPGDDNLQGQSGLDATNDRIESRFVAMESQIKSIVTAMASYANAVNLQTTQINRQQVKPPTTAQQVSKTKTYAQVTKPTPTPTITTVKPLHARIPRSASQPRPETSKPAQQTTKRASKPADQKKNPTTADILASRTFASIAANSVNALQPKRTVSKLPDASAEDFDKIKLDTSFHVKSIQASGLDRFTILFDSAAQANAFDDAFNAKYAEVAQSIAPKPITPQFKLTGPFGEINDKVLTKSIVDQNPHIPADTITLDRKYRSGRQFWTCIYNCDQVILNTILTHGSILHGLQSFRCHEVIELMQCQRCCEYGHTAAKCKGQLACKICAGSHTHTECPNVDTPKCINCMNIPANNNTPIKVDHRATHDRCQVRVSRLNVVRAKLSKQ